MFKKFQSDTYTKIQHNNKNEKDVKKNILVCYDTRTISKTVNLCEDGSSIFINSKIVVMI